MLFVTCWYVWRGPDFIVPEGSEILFELDWMPNHSRLVQAYSDLFLKPPKPPLREEDEPA